MRQCVALRSRKHLGGSRPDRCPNAGAVYLGSGRFACKQHHTHGFVPADLDEGDQLAVDDRQAARMARVVEGER